MECVKRYTKTITFDETIAGDSVSKSKTIVVEATKKSTVSGTTVIANDATDHDMVVTVVLESGVKAEKEAAAMTEERTTDDIEDIEENSELRDFAAAATGYADYGKILSSDVTRNILAIEIEVGGTI